MQFGKADAIAYGERPRSLLVIAAMQGNIRLPAADDAALGLYKATRPESFRKLAVEHER